MLLLIIESSLNHAEKLIFFEIIALFIHVIGLYAVYGENIIFTFIYGSILGLFTIVLFAFSEENLPQEWYLYWYIKRIMLVVSILTFIYIYLNKLEYKYQFINFQQL